jgi:ferredoxin
VFGKIAGEIGSWLASHGYDSVDEIRGLSLRVGDPGRGLTAPVLDLDLCNGCGLCELSCTADAIHVVDKKAILDDEVCTRCGLCITRCRPGALMWTHPAAGPA